MPQLISMSDSDVSSTPSEQSTSIPSPPVLRRSPVRSGDYMAYPHENIWEDTPLQHQNVWTGRYSLLMSGEPNTSDSESETPPPSPASVQEPLAPPEHCSQACKTAIEELMSGDFDGSDVVYCDWSHTVEGMCYTHRARLTQ